MKLAIQAVSRTEAAWGRGHKKLIAPLQQLGDLYFALGQHREAEQVCLRLLSIATKSLGQEHAVVAGALKMLGEACDVQGLHVDAERFYLWSLSVSQELQTHESEATEILTRLVGLYRTAEEPFKAGVVEKRLLRSLTIAPKARSRAS